MSRRIGIVVNRRSHGVARRGAILDAAGKALPEATVAHLDGLDTLGDCIRRMADAGVNTLFVEGGDGTVLAVLSACLAPGSGFATPPDLAILPGGSTNLAARSFGFRGLTPEVIARRILALAEGREAPRRQHLHALRVENAVLPHPAVGFVLSTGSLSRAMVYAQGAFLGKGRRGAAAVAMAIARFVLAPGRYRDADGRPVIRASRLSVRGDGVALDGQHAFGLATSLPRLSLGLVPFWGPGEGGIAFTHATWPVHHLRRVLARIALNRGGPHMAAHGVTSYRVDRLEIVHDDPVIIDGEVLPRAPDGRLIVTATPPLAFLR